MLSMQQTVSSSAQASPLVSRRAFSTKSAPWLAETMIGIALVDATPIQRGTVANIQRRFHFMVSALSFPLATIFAFSLDIGKESGARFIVISVTLFDQKLTYDGLQLLLILGISIVAAFVVERLAGRATPGGIVGAFFIALIGIWLFLSFIPLVWKGDYNIDRSEEHTSELQSHSF